VITNNDDNDDHDDELGNGAIGWEMTLNFMRFSNSTYTTCVKFVICR